MKTVMEYEMRTTEERIKELHRRTKELAKKKMSYCRHDKDVSIEKGVL